MVRHGTRLPPICYHCVGHSNEGLVGNMLYRVGVVVECVGFDHSSSLVMYVVVRLG